MVSFMTSEDILYNLYGINSIGIMGWYWDALLKNTQLPQSDGNYDVLLPILGV